MTINVTLVFQIIHFGLAYYILERLFFSVAISTINARDKHQKEFELSLEHQKKAVSTLHDITIRQTIECQKQLASKVPQSTMIANNKTISFISDKTIGKLNNKEKYITEVKNILLKDYFCIRST